MLTKTQHSEIMRIYDSYQLESQHDLDERISEVYSKDSEFESIDEQIVEASVEYAKKRIRGSRENLPPLSETIGKFSDRKLNLLKNLGYPEDYLKPRYRCPICQDTGYVGINKCSCFNKLATDMLYSHSNIKNMSADENFNTFRFDFYDDTDIDPVTGKTALANAKDAYEKARIFVDSFDKSFNNIFLYGDTGVGKTFLTNCIATEIIAMGKSTIYYTSFELFDMLAKTRFGGDSEDNNVYDAILSCDLLIIDDLGTELPNSLTASQLFLIVNERILREKATIISTNLAVPAFSEIYSTRTFSRISSEYTFLKLTGADIRVKIGNKSQLSRR